MKIEHVAMYVHSLEEAKLFFVKYFQAVPGTLYENPTTGFQSYFLTFDGGARLEIMTKPGLAEAVAAETGYAHIAFALGSREAVDVLTARLRADGYRVLSGPRITGDGYYESCIAGIEENLIELTV